MCCQLPKYLALWAVEGYSLEWRIWEASERGTFVRLQIVKEQRINILRYMKKAGNSVKWYLERFSFECRKLIGFALSTLRDWLKKFAPLFHPIRSKTKTNRDSLVRIFLRFASGSCNYVEFWLVHWIVCVFSDWLAELLWFWFMTLNWKLYRLILKENDKETTFFGDLFTHNADELSSIWKAPLFFNLSYMKGIPFCQNVY